MTTNEYRKTMISVLTIIKKEYEDEHLDNSPYKLGIVRGIQLAIDKLDYSKFLTEED